MKIIVGETYRSARGEKIGPVEHWAGNTDRVRNGPKIDGRYWFMDGTGGGYAKGNDLVAVWSEGPVRTVSRQEIIPGTYDGVVVGRQIEEPDCDSPDLAHVHKILVTLSGYKKASQLERAAAVLTALAGALRDGN